jgi:hypothetical protein
VYHKALISLVTLVKLKGVEQVRNRFQVALVITANNQSAISPQVPDIGSSPRFVQTTPATLQLPLRTLRRGLGVGRIRGEAIILLRCIAAARKPKRLGIVF